MTALSIRERLNCTTQTSLNFLLEKCRVAWAHASAERRELHGGQQHGRGAQRRRQLDQRVHICKLCPAGEASYLTHKIVFQCR